MNCKKSFRWTVGTIFFFSILAFASLGCHATMSVVTHAQRWETQRDRFELNGSVQEAHVKSLGEYRRDYKTAKQARLVGDREG